MAVACPQCGSDEIELIEVLEDERRSVECESCGHGWLRGEARRVFKTTSSIEDLRKSFPSPDDVRDEAADRARSLKEEYLKGHPAASTQALEFRQRYQDIFSKEGLAKAKPADLKYFANANLAGNPGNMSD